VDEPDVKRRDHWRLQRLLGKDEGKGKQKAVYRQHIAVD